MYYPKVLIIGNSFDEFSGAGITLTNLFKEWPRENIAIASVNIDMDYCRKERPCFSYFDFSQKQLENKSRHISSPSKMKSKIKRIIQKTGIQDFGTPFILSEQFLNFYDEFLPDIVYSALGGIGIMRFMLKLMDSRDFRLVVHIWDEFLARFDNRLCSDLWRQYADKLFKKVLSHENLVCLSIGDMMSKEYQDRYGLPFYPFHNPVDPEIWDIHDIKKSRQKIVISYFGKVNDNTFGGIEDMCKAVEAIAIGGVPICFEIHSGNIRLDMEGINRRYPHTIICPFLPRKDIPVAFKNSDILFYPISFDKKSVEYQRLSIHTKLTEYLISKVPILLYGSSKLAVYQYLDNNQAAILCDANNWEKLKEVLLNAIENKEYAGMLSENAYQLAIKKHTSSYVRNKFLQAITNGM